MSEAPKRIWADGDYTWASGSWFLVKGHDDVEYIRADLVEAAIKRALEEAMRIDAEYWKGSSRVSDLIAELDPAQFIKEPKE